MKRIIVVTVALAFVLLSAGAALAAISGSKHDMRTHISGETLGYDEVCVYCHTPHSGNNLAQLWNRTVPAAGTFTVYSAAVSSTLNSAPGGPGPGSLLCLSCHDGTMSIDSMVNAPNYGASGPGTNVLPNGVSVAKRIQGAALMGTDLTNDHPVGFVYDTALATADGGLTDPAVWSAFTATSVRLVGGKVECATCHDAHNTTVQPFLRSTNAASALCLRCHTK